MQTTPNPNCYCRFSYHYSFSLLFLLFPLILLPLFSPHLHPTPLLHPTCIHSPLSPKSLNNLLSLSPFPFISLFLFSHPSLPSCLTTTTHPKLLNAITPPVSSFSSFTFSHLLPLFSSHSSSFSSLLNATTFQFRPFPLSTYSLTFPLSFRLSDPTLL